VKAYVLSEKGELFTYLGHVEVYRRNLEILSLLNVLILAPATVAPAGGTVTSLGTDLITFLSL
jgi:hypothetical protein